jgi:hypothetical protein
MEDLHSLLLRWVLAPINQLKHLLRQAHLLRDFHTLPKSSQIDGLLAMRPISRAHHDAQREDSENA